MKTTRKTLAAVAALILFAAIALAKRKDSLVYDTPTPIYSGNSPEIVMATAAKDGTYRFGVSIETQPGDCEEDTVLYFVRSYVNTKGLSAGQRTEIKIRKKGSTVTSTAEIPAAVFRVKAGTRVSFTVNYMIGGRCKARPTYQVFPVLEQIGGKSK